MATIAARAAGGPTSLDPAAEAVTGRLVLRYQMVDTSAGVRKQGGGPVHGSSRWQKVVDVAGRVSNLSLDDLRGLLTRGLEIRLERDQVRRGEGLEATVLITSPPRLGLLEVGAVCTEHYDLHISNGKTSTRSTCTAVEHEAWQPVRSVPGEQHVRLAIPVDAPFSYEGSCVSYRWEVVVRGRRTRALDKRASQPISVRP